jgi:hypothetical protein
VVGGGGPILGWGGRSCVVESCAQEHQGLAKFVMLLALLVVHCDNRERETTHTHTHTHTHTTHTHKRVRLCARACVNTFALIYMCPHVCPLHPARLFYHPYLYIDVLIHTHTHTHTQPSQGRRLVICTRHTHSISREKRSKSRNKKPSQKDELAITT